MSFYLQEIFGLPELKQPSIISSTGMRVPVSMISCFSCGRKRLDHKDVGAYVIPKPPTGILQAFEGICAPLLDKLHEVTLQNDTLEKQRDFLLPLLMSGQVTVAE